MNEVTRVLSAIEQGDAQAAQELMPLVYQELRKLAAQRLASEKSAQTLQATALVHEADLRLVGGEQQWNGRGHFFAAAAEAMRRILVEAARSKARLKRGGGLNRVDLDRDDLATYAPPDALLVIDDAITALAAEDAQAAQLVKLRYFAGLSVEEPPPGAHTKRDGHLDGNALRGLCREPHADAIPLAQHGPCVIAQL